MEYTKSKVNPSQISADNPHEAWIKLELGMSEMVTAHVRLGKARSSHVAAMYFIQNLGC